MNTHVISQEDLKAYIPHRFENLVIDTVTPFRDATASKGQLTVTISNDDPLNRHLFSKKDDNGTPVLITGILMEILALGSITSTGKIPKDHMVFYTSIMNFELFHLPPLGTTVIGEVVQLNSKAGFLKYGGTLATNTNIPICKGDMMAFYTKISKETSNIEKKVFALPKQTTSIPIAKDLWVKSPDMVILDELIHISFDTPSVFGTYTFPSTHPTIKGHFPNHPVMMGILQWTAIEDLLFAYALELKKVGRSPKRLKANATLLSDQGHMIAICKEIIVELHLAPSTQFPQATIIRTKNIKFKSMVSPGDKFYIGATNIEEIDPNDTH